MTTDIKDDEAGKKIIEKILSANPNLKRGDDMKGPIGLFTYGGKIVIDDSTTDAIAIEAGSIKILRDLDQQNFDNKYIFNGYLHYYTCLRVDIDFKVGDIITVIDSITFLPTKIKATKQHIDGNSYYLFRFGISNSEMIFTRPKLEDMDF